MVVVGNTVLNVAIPPLSASLHATQTQLQWMVDAYGPVVAGRFLVPTSRESQHAALDPVGAGLSIVGISVLVYGIIEAPIHGWTTPVTLGCIVASILVLGGFVFWERNSSHPMLDMHQFS